MEDDRDRSMSDSHEIAIQPDNHGIKDRVFSKIKADLSSSSLLSSSSTEQPGICKIRKVQPHDRPREKTMSAYTPKMISIGPLHHGMPELQPMEVLKHKYLNELLNRRGEDLNYELSSDGKNDELLGRFIKEAINMEKEVRESYELSNINTISSDDFVRMLVIDGCFILEFLLRGNLWSDDYGKSDDLGRQGPLINQDIQLFENQIPFFVLQKFHEILTEYGVYIRSIEQVAYDYMLKNHLTFGVVFRVEESLDPSNLLHLHYMKVVVPHFSLGLGKRFLYKFQKITRWMVSILSSFFYFIYKIFFVDITYPTKLISATEIEEAGVRLQGSCTDLRFEQGTLLVPVLILNQESLRLLKNLMVFEFYFRSLVPPYVHTYVSFLSLLIKNPGDLKVMEKYDIMITSGGGDESFALVNELIQAGFEELMLGEADLNWQSRFSIIDDLKTYCKEPIHRWRAKLMKDYYGNPWSTLGVLAGVILLVLTTLQTVFTLLSYYHQQIGG